MKVEIFDVIVWFIPRLSTETMLLILDGNPEIGVQCKGGVKLELWYDIWLDRQQSIIWKNSA